MKTKSAFTLIELLVVIGIIAILAAILFPVFASAREKARSVTCLSNMKQLGLSLTMYSTDYDERYPMTANYGLTSKPIWTDQLFPYFKSKDVVKCPSAMQPGYAADWNSRGYSSIGMTALAAFDPTQAEGFSDVLSEASLMEVARTPLLGETPNAPVGGPLGRYRGHNFDPCVSDWLVPSTEDDQLIPPRIADIDLIAARPDLVAGRLKPLFARHHTDGKGNGRVNLIMADGHAKSYSANQVAARGAGANLLWRFRKCPY
ncbi:MAG: hypothetical protein RLZ42_523 [Armatimonadota bacterium]